MWNKTISLALLFAIRTQAQVLDVNGDGTVGPHEAIAVAEEWKQEAKAADEHDHLGQTWKGYRNPLTIRGNFSPRSIIVPGKDGQKAVEPVPSAPLILDNTATPPSGSYSPDLILDGNGGTIAAIGWVGSSLSLVSNGSISFFLNSEDFPGPDNFDIYNAEKQIIASIRGTGSMSIVGNLTTAGGTYKIDHPQSPSTKLLAHSNVGSPEMMNLYSGNVVLDSEGNSWVELPGYFEALNSDFRYTLTPIGAAAPNLHVAEEIQNNRFKIAGGTPGLKVSWQVTGIRQDAYAKANPIEVEQEKSVEEKGKYLHPELFGEPATKSVGFAKGIEGE